MDTTSSIMRRLKQLDEDVLHLKQELKDTQGNIENLEREKTTPPVNNTKGFQQAMLGLSKNVLPHMARFFIINTFLEGNVCTWMRLSERMESEKIVDLSVDEFLASSFLMIFLVGQLLVCTAILCRYKVSIACGILFGIIILQTVFYGLRMDVNFLSRNLVLAGGVLLLLAEDMAKGKFLFAAAGHSFTVSKHHVQLSCHTFLNVISLVIVSYLDYKPVLKLIGIVLVVCVAFGYKTKLFTPILVVGLACLNCYFNNWWKSPDSRSDDYHHMNSFEREHHDQILRMNALNREHSKCNFFMTMSVIGGLLLAAFQPHDVQTNKE